MCAISGFHIRSHQILLQLKLLDSIKEAGNVKRFLPSEFGTDPATMENAKAIEEGGIPFTYVYANCFRILTYPDCILTYRDCILADLGGLCQPSQILPSKDHVVLLGDGNYTLNKSLNIRPPKNILYQRQVVQVWKKFIGKELQKSFISKEEFLTAMKVDTYYHVCYEGCLTNFKI
ncbi:hypothetical protein ACOSQ3_013975 [Xanthoceras sorbifolium]